MSTQGFNGSGFGFVVYIMHVCRVPLHSVLCNTQAVQPSRSRAVVQYSTALPYTRRLKHGRTGRLHIQPDGGTLKIMKPRCLPTSETGLEFGSILVEGL